MIEPNSANIPAGGEWTLTTMPARLGAFLSGNFVPRTDLEAAWATQLAVTNERDALKARAEAADASLTLSVDQITAKDAEILDLRGQIASLSTDVAALTTDVATLQARLDDPSGETALKARALVAGQGIEAGKAPVTGAKGAVEDVAALSLQMDAATDPKVRSELYSRIFPNKRG